MTTMKIWFLGLIALVLMTACGKSRSQEEEHHDEVDTLRIVTLTAQQMSTAQIVLAAAELRASGSEIEATAQIQAAPDRTAHVGPRISGRVVSFSTRVGDNVSAGQSLAVIDSPELSRAKADYVNALTASTLARQVADKERVLFERRISSEREWRTAEAEALRAQAEQRAAEDALHTLGVADSSLKALESGGHYASTFDLVSPISGHVVAHQGALGQVVESGFAVFTVMDLRQVWAVADMYEQDLKSVSTGQAVQVRVAAYPDRTFRGRVDNVGAVLETGTRTVKVRVVLQNGDLALKPGMFATVTLAPAPTDSTRRSVFVPASAVQRDAQNTIVFVALGGSKFQSRTISAGKVGPNWVEVLSGVSAGDSVVTSGAFLLKSQLRKGQLGESHPHG